MANSGSEGEPSSPSGNSSQTTILSDETTSRQLSLSSDSDSYSEYRRGRERSRSPRARMHISSSSIDLGGAESSRQRYQEPPYFWADTPSNSSPDFEPEPREFDLGRLDIPYDFVSKFPKNSQSEVQIWLEKLKTLYGDYRDRHAELVGMIQDLERGMRRMESQRKDWVKFKLGNISPMPSVLRSNCLRKNQDD